MNSSGRVFLHVVLGSNPAGSVGSGRGISTISPPSTGVSGFLGLVQELQRIRNQEANVAKLNDSLYNWKQHSKLGRIGSRLQVDQARQALFNGQSRLLAAKSSFANRLDGYKMFLGLPPDLSMRVMDNDYIENFRLTDLELVGLRKPLTILSAVRNPEEVSTLESLRSYFEQVVQLDKDTAQHGKLRKDFSKFQEVLPQRKMVLPACENGLDLKELGMGEEAFRDEDLDRLLEELNSTITGSIDSLLQFYENIEEWEEESEALPLEAAWGRFSLC